MIKLTASSQTQSIIPNSFKQHHHHQPRMKNYTIRFPNWGQTVDVYARFDSDAIESARIVLELPCRALWDGRIVNIEELSK